MKKTIAIVGATENEGQEIAQQLAQTNCCLLLVSENKVALEKLCQTITSSHPNAEISFVECVKDGCWEADIIVLAVEAREEEKVALLMKEVATQKIIVRISDATAQAGILEKILTYSKLVTVMATRNIKEVEITGAHSEANKEVAAIFNNAGYHVNIAA